jgi:hypothetical protein
VTAGVLDDNRYEAQVSAVARLENVRKVADEIRAAGGTAEADEVDALDEQAVNHHADRVLIMSGTLDLSFNLINLGDRQGTPLVDIWCSLSYPRAAESKCRGQLG